MERSWLVLVVSLLWACPVSPAGDAPGTARGRLAGEKERAYSEAAIARATEALWEAAKRVRNDRTRPAFHFLPPAQWMNDPCGGIHRKGCYHLFYQLNPYADVWAEIHWGHARSRDLVRWEHLPIALAPLPHEVRCNSGCVTINKPGEPMIFYTSVLRGSPREQCAAVGDKDLMVWRRHPDNPLIDLKTHGGPRFGGGWSDMFVFEEAGRTFMLIGVDRLGDEVAVPIYEAEDAGMARWKYKGLLYRAPREKIGNMEVPMFCRLSGTWVLMFHPGGPIKYLVGDFDLQSLTFEPQTGGEITPSRDFMSPHVFFDDKGRCIIYGWIRGFEGGHGWNGCMSLPRVISLDENRVLRQRPVPELKSLRAEHTGQNNIVLNNTSRHLETGGTDTLEITAVFRAAGAKTFGLKLRRTEEEEKAIVISCEDGQLKVAGVEVPICFDKDERTVTVNIFVDRSVLEVFANDGRCYVAKVIYPGDGRLDVQVFAEGGTAAVQSLDVWHLESIW